MYGVGKTSLIQRFVYDIFDESYLSTIGVRVVQKICPPVEDAHGKIKQIHLLVWDMEGQSSDHTTPSSYYLGASGALLVMDVTRPESIDCIPGLRNTIQKISPGISILYMANKYDLLVRENNVQKRIEEVLNPGNTLFYTSAKTGHQVEKAFLSLAQTMIQ